MRRHLLAGAAVDDDRVLGAEPARHAGRVHGGISTAIDGDPTLDVGAPALLDGAQEAHGVQHPPGVTIGNVHPFRQVRAHGHEGGAEAVLKFRPQVAHGVVLLEPDAEVDHPGDLRVDDVPRETVCRDAIAHHAARLATAVAHRNLVAEPCQVVCRGQPAGAGPDDQDPLAAGWRRAGKCPALFDRGVPQQSFDRVDRDSAVHLRAIAH